MARHGRGGGGVNQDQIWSQVQEELRFQLAKRTYDMWLKNTSVVSADGGTFRIGVPSKLAKDWLEDRFTGLRTRCSTATAITDPKTATRPWPRRWSRRRCCPRS